MASFKFVTGFYVKLMNTHPWKTTALSTGLICVAGDIIAQQLVERKGLKQHDMRRTVKLFGMGTLFIGPGLRTWYFFLDKIIKGTTSTAVLKKVCLDQVIWAPLFIATYFTLSDLLDGKAFPDIKRRLQCSYVPAMKTNYMIWPAVQLANFYLIPLQHRVLVVNFVALFWNTYLATASNASVVDA